MSTFKNENVVFIFNNKVELKANMDVLANKSDVFCVMFNGTGTALNFETNDQEQHVVRIVDIDSDIFEYLLDYMSNTPTNFRLTEDNVDQVIYAADKYNLQEIFRMCDIFMYSTLNVSNAIKFLATAKLFNLRKLEYEALHYAAKFADIAFSPAACTYANIDLWKSVLSSLYCQVKDFQLLLNNAIFWATQCQGEHDVSINEARKILNPIQSLLMKFETEISEKCIILNNPHLKTFFPKIRFGRAKYCSTFLFAATANYRNTSLNFQAIQFKLDKTAVLTNVISETKMNIEVYNEAKRVWKNLIASTPVDIKVRCLKNKIYTVVFGRHDAMKMKGAYPYFNCLCSHILCMRLSVEDFCACGGGCVQSSYTMTSDDGNISATIYGSSIAATLVFQY